MQEIDHDALVGLINDAKSVRSNNISPDWVVLKAVGLGVETRRELKEVLGFSYDVIEKALERCAGDLRIQQNGPIEKFELRRPLVNGELDTSASAPPTCERCGGPRSVGSASLCRKCYGKTGTVQPPTHAKEDNYEVFDKNDFTKALETVSQKLCGCGRDFKHGGRCWYRRKTKPTLFDKNHPPKIPEVVVPETAMEVAQPIQGEVVEEFKRDSFCLESCFPEREDIGHHINCKYWTDDERATILKEQEVPPRKIKHAWSKDFESEDPEGVPGLTMLYLVSMLHDGMEQVEKEAVWTLIQYLKRAQAAGEK